MDRGSWQATIHEIAESDTTEPLNRHHQRGLNGRPTRYVHILILQTYERYLIYKSRNITLYGSMIKLILRGGLSGSALNTITCAFLRKEPWDTQRRGHVQMEATWRLEWQPPAAGRGKRRVLPMSRWKEHSPVTLVSAWWTWSWALASQILRE